MASHTADLARTASQTDVTRTESAEPIEQFSYDDRIVRQFVSATVLWGLVGTLAGLIVAVILVLPKMMEPLGPFAQYLTFGRLRPLHTNAAIFAFAGNAVFAAVYYSTQRLCKARMWSDTLSQLHFWGWQLIIVAAAVTLPWGSLRAKSTRSLNGLSTWPSPSSGSASSAPTSL